MLYRVIGSAGSGKTEYLLGRIGECIKKQQRVILLVPEQQSVSCETMLCDRFGNGCNMYCEVLNFERLPNRIAREYGGLAVKYIDKGGACALLSVTAESVADRLTEYAPVVSDADFIKKLLAFISRLKMSMVTPEMLSSLASSNIISEDGRLCRKIRDIALIYEEYSKHFGKSVSDPQDSLTSLIDKLPEKPFFGGAYVFIDGYYNFTEQEYGVISEIIKQASDTYVTFTFEEGRSFFSENGKAAERIKKLASGKCEDIDTGFSRRTKNKELLHIERNFLSEKAEAISGDDGSVRLIGAETRFDEAEAAASEILEYIREGNSFGSVFVLCRRTENYQGIIESVFSRAEIPCYTSLKEELLSKPLFAFLCASIGVIIENFSCRSVKRYIKSGFTDLSVQESDILLGYAESWNIRGKRWYSGGEWTMDPEGYSDSGLSVRGIEILKIVNDARDKLVKPLAALNDSLSVKDMTVGSGVRALYSHLIGCEADERLRSVAEKKSVSGDREGSERDIQLWKILIGIFDQLDEVCGSFPSTPKKLLALIKLVTSCYSLGAIPALSDAVTFGSAELIRAGNCGLTVLLGMCDGEFPASVSGRGFFSNDEEVRLEGAGCDFADSLDRLLGKEHFLVYSALSSPRDRLVITYPENEITGDKKRPSVAVKAIKIILPDLKARIFGESDMLYCRGKIAEYFPLLADNCEKERIKTILKEKGVDFYCDEPEVCDRESKVCNNSDFLTLSPSKLETYRLCPFSYFGKYMLSLREKKVFDWSSPDTGSFIHRILEKFLRECADRGDIADISDEQRIKRVTELTSEQFNTITDPEMLSDMRFLHTRDRLLQTLLLATKNICSEFADSDFRPVGFEFSVGLGENQDIPPVIYDTDGKKVSLRGIIDRVDTYSDGEKSYARVIDYKTYEKKISLALVDNGIDTQMLHYLFAFCREKGMIPAGVIYQQIKLPFVSREKASSPEALEKALGGELKRSGFLLDDHDVVQAMSRSFEFVPAKETVNHTLYKSNSLLTENQFSELENKLGAQICDTAVKIFRGETDIAPDDIDGRADPCKYCKLRPVCRYK